MFIGLTEKKKKRRRWKKRRKKDLHFQSREAGAAVGAGKLVP